MILLTWTIYCHHQKVLHNMEWMAFTIRENLSLILSELEWVGTSYDINIENCFAAPMPMKIISNGNIFYSSQKIYTIYYTVEEIHIKNIEYLFWMQITIKIVYSNYGNSLDMNILGLMDLKAHPRKKTIISHKEQEYDVSYCLNNYLFTFEGTKTTWSSYAYNGFFVHFFQRWFMCAVLRNRTSGW